MKSIAFILSLGFSIAAHCQTPGQLHPEFNFNPTSPYSFKTGPAALGPFGTKKPTAFDQAIQGFKSQILNESNLNREFLEIRKRLGGDAGGGDWIRSIFIFSAEKIQTYLNETVEGKALAKAHQLEHIDFGKIASVESLIVLEQTLVDRTGSVVDAIVKDGILYLSQHRWEDLFSQRKDAHYIVFHELLRLAGVNDEGYRISKLIKDIPKAYLVLTPALRARELSEDGSLRTIVELKNPIFNGSGCTTYGTSSIELNATDNSLTLFPSEMTSATGGPSGQVIDRKTCMISVPASVKPGYQLRVTQVDILREENGDGMATGSVNTEIFWSGARGVNLPQRGLIKNGSSLTREVLSFVTPCGGSFNLRTNSVVSIDPRKSDVPVSLGMSRMKLYFKIEKCQ